MVDINWIAVVVAAISAFIIGALWYGPLFGKAWQKMVGLSDKELQVGQAKIFGGAFVLTLVMSITLALFIGDDTLPWGLFVGLASGLGLAATAFGVNYLFEHKSLKFYLINAGYNVIIMTLIGGILGAF